MDKNKDMEGKRTALTSESKEKVAVQSKAFVAK
jgi:hypothetical protein